MNNTYYDYFLEFPYSKIKTNYKEISTRDQLYLSKSRLTFSDKLEYIVFVKDIYKSITKNKKDFDSIDLIEFLFFIIKNRIISSGHMMELMTEINGMTAKINLNLNDVLKNIFNNLNMDLLQIKDENYNINIGFPYLKDFEKIFNCRKNTLDIINTFYLFIKNINGIDFINLTHEQREILYNQLPVSLVFKIKENILKLFENFDNMNVFNIDFFKNFKLNIYSESYIEIIKIFSLYDIESIHREIYILSDMNPEYLMKTSPSERKMYLNFYITEKKQKSGDNSNPFSMG